MSEPRIALVKKGSFTQLDLDDVDVASRGDVAVETCFTERSIGRKDRLFLPPVQIINQDFDITDQGSQLTTLNYQLTLNSKL